jgi:hypothetical protein
VPDHDFLFALDLSDEPHFDGMLAALTGTVLTYLGYPPAAVQELRDELHGALKAGLSNGHHRCDVQFRAHGGELVITAACDGGVSWRTARSLP